MIKAVMAIYDRPTGLHDSPMVFENALIGVSRVRRDIRDMYLKEQITYDALRDRDLYEIAAYDTDKGTFENVEDGVHYNMASFVGDLIVRKDEVQD